MAPPVRLSVLMPVYNAAGFLREAVESVLGQSVRDLELVVIDDGSTDGSGPILDGYAAADPRVRLIRQANAGYTLALRRGYAACRADAVARMDADDICLPGRLEKQLAFLDANPAYVAVGCRAIDIDECGVERGRPDTPTDHAAIDAWHMSGRGSALYHPSVTFRRAAYDRVGGYRPAHEPAEDFDLWLRLAEVGGLAALPGRLLKYRVHRQSVSRQRSRVQERAMWGSLREAVGRRGHPLTAVPFAELAGNDQVNWIDLAIDLGRGVAARRWAWQRLQGRRGRAEVKQFGKACLTPWLDTLLPWYDRALGRPTVRRAALDREGVAGGM